MVEPEPFRFLLFVVGPSGRGQTALRNLRRACEARLPGQYRIVVIDVAVDPLAADEASVVATPTLIRIAPEPRVRLVGDLSREDEVVDLLGLDQEPTEVRWA